MIEALKVRFTNKLALWVCGHGGMLEKIPVWDALKALKPSHLFHMPWLYYVTRSRRQGGADSFVIVQSAQWKDNGLLLSVGHSNELVHHLREESVGEGKDGWEVRGLAGGCMEWGLRNAHPSGAIPRVWLETQPPQTSRPVHHRLYKWRENYHIIYGGTKVP